uniref:Uncharacterized protein LOC100175780 n=1 Tax=Phallusia mammillata TaxID=59560 RepID=A0A6F9DH34_9ASCI|nr:uncharacterized protein LOC100175780 [Phallusia mammillata]
MEPHTHREMIPHDTAVEFLNCFEMIGCPYTADIDPTYLSELLLHPSPYRMRLLTWVFSSIDPEFEKQIESYSQKHGNYSANLQVEGMVPLLTSLASLLFLCSSDDFELTKGTASSPKQIVFWENLLVIAKSSDKACSNMGLPEPNVIHSTMEKLLKTCNVSSAFAEPTVLLPPAIIKEVHMSQKLLPQSKTMRVSPEDISSHLMELKKEFAGYEEKLSQLESEFPNSAIKSDDPSRLNKLTCSLNLMVGDLDQLETTFNETFDNNMRPFCTRTAPTFGHLGPTIQSTDRQLSNYIKMVENLKQIKKFHDNVSTCTKGESKGKFWFKLCCNSCKIET